MKKLLFAVVMMLLALAPATSFAQKSKDRKALFNSWNNYEVTTVKVGTDGTKFIKVWGFGKKVDLAIVQAKKNAVHACLFRGLMICLLGGGIAAQAQYPDGQRGLFHELFRDGRRIP